jgi:hypothetical protein
VGAPPSPAARRSPPAKAAPNRLFQLLNFYWSSPKSGGWWYKSWRWNVTICCPSEDWWAAAGKQWTTVPGGTPIAPCPIEEGTLERRRQTQDSQDQILALAFREKSSKPSSCCLFAQKRVESPCDAVTGGTPIAPCTKPSFSGPWFVLELAEIRRLVVHIKAIEADNSLPF